MNRPLTVSAVVLVTLLVVLNFASSLNATEDLSNPIRFAIIGDRTGGHTPGIYGEILTEIDGLRPDFIMNVGDMIEGYSDDVDEVRGEWEEYLELVDTSSAQIHPTPGNHDIYDDTGESLKLYEEFMGQPDYSFDYRGLHVVVLDTSRWESSDELPREKFDWLAGDLEENRDALYTAVFFHKPFWFDNLAHGEPGPLHDLFKMYGVDAVFTGHYHEYFSGEYDGIQYTSFGSSGGMMSPGVTGLEYHFGWVTVDNDGIHVALIKKDSVLPWDEFTAGDKLSVKAIEKEAFHSDNSVTVGADMKFENAAWEFTLKNPSENLTVSDTLRWEVPDGWSVSPDTLPIELAPGAEKKVTVILSCRGSLFPAPVFSLNIPYKDGGEYDLTRQARVVRQALCTRAEQEPKIDGKIEENGVWKSSEDHFFGPKGAEPEIETSRFYFAYDKDNLYIAVECVESELESIKASAIMRDDAVYNDDCVGFFLTSPGKEDSLDIYQFFFNSNGVVFDQRLRYEDGEIVEADKDWDMACEVRGGKKDGAWTLEARIPLKDFGVAEVASGDRLLINLGRIQQRMGTFVDWMIPWDYDPDTLGEMVFE